MAFCERIIARIAEPYELGGQIVSVGTSIGIAFAPEHGVEPDTLIRNADLALYRAKSEGRNTFSIYDVELMHVATVRQQFETELREVLAESGLPAKRLEIEITENVFLAGDQDNIATVTEIKALGVSIALDDFGTGYSSLSYLTTFPFDRVKIDRSFTTNMTKRADCAAVIASVVTLTRSLGVTTTAEGVESRAQFELLCGAGVDFCQGYLFGRPTPAARLDVTRTIEPGHAVAVA